MRLARGLFDPPPPPERLCGLCLGETKGDGPAMCLDPDPCIRATGKLDPIVFLDKSDARLNASRARAGKPPIQPRRYLIGAKR